VFRTKTYDNEESRLTDALVMQPATDGLHFTFVSSVYGHMSLPTSGKCEPIQQ